MRKLLIYLLIALVCNLIPSYAYAEQPSGSEGVVIKQLAMCYADCWRDSGWNWKNATGFDGTVYRALQPDRPIDVFKLQVGFIGEANGVPQLVDVEAVPVSISQSLYDSLSNRDNIAIENTGYGAREAIPDLGKLNEYLKYSGSIGPIDKEQGTSANGTVARNLCKYQVGVKQN